MPERIPEETLAPVVWGGDAEWTTVVRWVVFGLVLADKHGLTQANMEAIAADPSGPFAGLSREKKGQLGRAFGVALAASFTEWPTATLPVFVAMMFGATLEGNATLVGASAHMVAVGICAKKAERVSFMHFARYGLPITLVQLAMGALYVLVLTALMG